MSARTTTADGNVSNADGSALNGGSVLGTTDTLTSSHNITFTASTQCGSSPATGGTAAIAMSNSVDSKTITVGAGFEIDSAGDFTFNANGNTLYSTLQLNAGAKYDFVPASGQQYKFGFTQMGKIVANGTSGAHCQLSTDKSGGGLSSLMTVASYRNQGLFTATYLDVTNFGTTASSGVKTLLDRPSNSDDVSLSNLTFTGSSYQVNINPSGTNIWSGNYTLQNAVFNSSVGLTLSGIDYCFLFDTASTTTAGAYLIDGLGCDIAAYFVRCYRTTISNSVFAGGVAFRPTGTATWTSDDNCHHIAVTREGTTGNFLGPIRDCYLACNGATNDTLPGIESAVPAASYTDVISENTNTSNDGQGSMGSITSGSAAFLRYLALPTHGTTNPGGILSYNAATTGGTSTINHCTIHIGANQAAVQLGEANDPPIGVCTIFKNSIVWCNDGASNQRWFVWDLNSGGGSATLDAVTPAGVHHNAGYGLQASTPSGTYANANNSCQANFSTSPNTDLTTLSAIPFVDISANIRTWGTSKGTDGSLSAAWDLLRQNTSYVAEADTGLLDWIFGKFGVTGADGLLVKDAGDDNLTIGAGDYVAPASTGSIGIGDLFGNIFGNVFGDLEPPITGY